MYRYVFILCLALGVLSAGDLRAQQGVGGSIDVEAVDPRRIDRTVKHWSYSAKFLCGTMDPDNGAVPPNPQFPDPDRTHVFVPGTYLTGVNIRNPNAKRIRFTKSAVATPPERFIKELPRKVLAPGPAVEEVLDPGFGLEVDCRDIVSADPDAAAQPPLLPNIPIDLTKDFITGFVVIESADQMDVVAVYSFKNVEP
jgi:hypothetical protein